MYRLTEAGEQYLKDRVLIENWFSYHTPTEDQVELLSEIRAIFKDLGYFLIANVVNSRERSIALTELRKTAMVCNMAIVFDRD